MRLIVIILMLMPLFSAGAEKKASSYIPPVDLPLHLSANFGEIRSTHFHAGIDIKTQGTVGHKILAVADGYVSRISFSPVGYGKAIYITHPSLGTTTVYGHLLSLAEPLASFVKDYQYRHKTFSCNLYPPKNQFQFKGGEVIALSGNSGSSGGPHLHFEVRNTLTSNPLDPIVECQYSVLDSTPPTIFSIGGVEIDNTYPLHIPLERKKATLQSKGKYLLKDTIFVSRDSYLAFEIVDRKDNSTNVFATRKLSLSCKGIEVWGSYTNRVSFSYGASVSSYSLYPQTTKTRNDIVRTYIDGSNPLDFYTSKINNGIIYLSQLKDAPLDYTLTAADEFGNSSTISFVVAISPQPFKAIEQPEGELLRAEKFFSHVTSDFSFLVSPHTFQQSCYLVAKAEDNEAFYLSKVVTIGSEQMPLKKSATLSIRPNSGCYSGDMSKLSLAWLDSSDRPHFVSSRFEKGSVVAEIRSVGRYVIVSDTIKPQILSNWSGKYPIRDFVSFKITEEGSGVASYRGYINGEWEIFEFDPKTSRILYYLDPEKYKKGVKHRVKLVVKDAKDNEATFETSFSW